MDVGLTVVVALAIIAWLASVATGAFLQWVPSPPSWVVRNRRRAWMLVGMFVMTGSAATAAAVVIEARQQEERPSHSSVLSESAGETCAGELEHVSEPWGPERELFTMSRVASHPTLNSTLGSSYGDERNFVTAAHEDKVPRWCGTLRVRDGDRILVRAYVVNSAADDLRGRNLDGPGVAHGVKIQFLPDQQSASRRLISGIVSAENTTPARVYDSVELLSDRPFRLDYVVGSGQMYTNSLEHGVPLDDRVWNGDGALIGYFGPDGAVPPGYEYDLIATVTLRVTAVA